MSHPATMTESAEQLCPYTAHCAATQSTISGASCFCFLYVISLLSKTSWCKAMTFCSNLLRLVYKKLIIKNSQCVANYEWKQCFAWVQEERKHQRFAKARPHSGAAVNIKARDKLPTCLGRTCRILKEEELTVTSACDLFWARGYMFLSLLSGT